MTEIRFRSDFTVETIQQMGSDLMIANAAWISTGLDYKRFDFSDEELQKKVRGLLKFLTEKKHGTPFEAGCITLRVEAPIFVWREWHRHRIGFSYNEESGRYKQLQPVFYVPGEERRLHCLKPADFKPSKPGFEGMLELDQKTFDHDNALLRSLYSEAYRLYEYRLAAGYDNGLARVDLPVGIYSSCYVTCNPRSLMAFLELRVDDPTSRDRSHPLWEMHQVAKQVEAEFQQHWPITYELWNANGRVAP